MRNRKSFTVAMLGINSCALVASGAANLVAPLKNQQTIDGCSWSASAATIGDGFVFLAEYDESRIVMNIGGSDVELRLAEARGQLTKVGDVSERKFVSGDVTVSARYKVTWVCPEDSDSCEVTKFDVTFLVKKGAQSETVDAAGSVGC
jgi:hypothetical protein